MARLFKGPAVVGFAPLRARCAHPPLREAHDDFNRGFYRKNVTLTRISSMTPWGIMPAGSGGNSTGNPWDA